MSKPNLDTDKRLLVKSLRLAKTSQALSKLLEDLLTQEEVLELAQRLKIAKLILAGKNYDEISQSVDASTTTISRIGQNIKYGTNGFKILIGKSLSADLLRRQ